MVTFGKGRIIGFTMVCIELKAFNNSRMEFHQRLINSLKYFKIVFILKFFQCIFHGKVCSHSLSCNATQIFSNKDIAKANASKSVAFVLV